MPAVTDLQLPELDFFSPELKGARLHDEMGRLSSARGSGARRGT